MCQGIYILIHKQKKEKPDPKGSPPCTILAHFSKSVDHRHQYLTLNSQLYPLVPMTQISIGVPFLSPLLYNVLHYCHSSTLTYITPFRGFLLHWVGTQSLFVSWSLLFSSCLISQPAHPHPPCSRFIEKLYLVGA